MLATSKTFPKGCHLFGGDGRQAGTTTITDLQVLTRRVPLLTLVPLGKRETAEAVGRSRRLRPRIIIYTQPPLAT